MLSHRTFRAAILSFIVVAGVAATAAAQRTTEPDPQEEKKTQWLTMRDIPGLVGLAVLLLSIPTAVYIWQRRQVSFGNPAEAEAAFEREALKELGAEGAQASPATPSAPSLSAPASSPKGTALPYLPRAAGFDTKPWSQEPTQMEDDSGQPAPGGIEVRAPLGSEPKQPTATLRTAPPPERTAPAAATSGVDRPPANVEELVRRLQALTIIGDLEGRIPMPIPPDGVIHRLRKSNGIAAILPRLESEAIMAHHARRFDMVFALTSSGEVVVLSRLQNRLSDLMERAGDFR